MASSIARTVRAIWFAWGSSRDHDALKPAITPPVVLVIMKSGGLAARDDLAPIPPAGGVEGPRQGAGPFNSSVGKVKAEQAARIKGTSYIGKVASSLSSELWRSTPVLCRSDLSWVRIVSRVTPRCAAISSSECSA